MYAFKRIYLIERIFYFNESTKFQSNYCKNSVIRETSLEKTSRKVKKRNLYHHDRGPVEFNRLARIFWQPSVPRFSSQNTLFTGLNNPSVQRIKKRNPVYHSRNEQRDQRFQRNSATNARFVSEAPRRRSLTVRQGLRINFCFVDGSSITAFPPR